jgi:hypothetical protein
MKEYKLTIKQEEYSKLIEVLDTLNFYYLTGDGEVLSSKSLPEKDNAIEKEAWESVRKRWSATHTIEKVMGTEVTLSDLEDNQSVCYGDGKTFHFRLTKINNQNNQS